MKKKKKIIRKIKKWTYNHKSKIIKINLKNKNILKKVSLIININVKIKIRKYAKQVIIIWNFGEINKN